MANIELMKKILLFSLTLSAITSLFPWQPAQARCPSGNSRSNSYIRRNNDERCEGISTQNIASSFELVSLAIGKIAKPQNRYSLTVPNYQGKQPKVRVRSIKKKYQLDPLNLKLSQGQYPFQWSNYVINKAGINPLSLVGKAFVRDGKRIYLPVRFNNANRYDIVLYAESPAKIPKFTIEQKGKIIYQASKNNWQPEGLIRFSWDGKSSDGKDAPPAIYRLVVKAKLQQDKGPDEDEDINLSFAHNPNWLR